jgi:hypothetical protein
MNNGQSAGNQIIFLIRVGSSETTRLTPFYFSLCLPFALDLPWSKARESQKAKVKKLRVKI